MPKRRKTEDAHDVEDVAPRKSRRTSAKNDEPAAESPPSETPSKRKPILRGASSKINGVSESESTPKSQRKVLFSTPSKPTEDAEPENEETPTATRNDRSARRKSARSLQQAAPDDSSDEETQKQIELVARQVLDEESDQEEEEEVESTPAKRGRPKGRRREPTPSPPPDLPPHELYFFQNRTGANKTSSNTLPSHLLLNHEDYFAQIKAYEDPHTEDIKTLKELHKRAFDQWMFELDEGFNICLYGYGSKRELVMEFAEHTYSQSEKPPKIVVVNGYTPGLTIRDILATLAGVILPKNTKLPAHPQALFELLLSRLAENAPKTPIKLVIHTLDHPNLRRGATQSQLARLSAHPSIHLIATCDTPNFPLLWDTTLLRQFRWLYHDATTFQPYTVEIDVVEDVNALLGRSSRRLGGKDGVGYVLKSLPENAKNLFRILVAEQLALAAFEPDTHAGAGENDLDPDDILGAEDEDDAAAEQATPSKRGRGKNSKSPKASKAPPKPAITASPEGVEYRTLYHKAVEEFVCSSELSFRTLLKEFHDHQMIESRKDAMGTERLIAPFRRDELEGILEELV